MQHDRQQYVTLRTFLQQLLPWKNKNYSIVYSNYVSVALLIQEAKRMRCIIFVICILSGNTSWYRAQRARRRVTPTVPVGIGRTVTEEW